LERGEAASAGGADPAAADRGFILGRPRILHLRVETAAIRTPHRWPLCALLLRIDREARKKLLGLLADLAFDKAVFLDTLLRQHAQHFGDHVADFLELRDAEAARRAGRRAEP